MVLVLVGGEVRDEPVVVLVTERDETSSKAENGCTLIRQQAKIKR